MGPKTVDIKKFGGNYIATESFTSEKIIAYGEDLVKVYNEAQEQGAKDPVINYIQKEGVVCIY